MKAWRQKGNQAQFRKDIGDPVRLRGRRIGRLLKANVTRILPHPSFLLQQLLINAGWMKGA